MIKDLDNKIRAYALRNAISYNGKANPGSVVSSLFNEGLQKNEVKDVMPKIQAIIKEIEKLGLDKQKEEYEKLEKLTSHRSTREGLPELPGAEKGVVMRFAPSPSGPFHLGHIMTSCISYLYVKKYGGKFYLRIEDTNPENIYKPAYKMLENEANWLFNKNVEVVVQSDRMSLYYEYAEKLIDKNSAYVCTCSSEDFKKYVDSKKDCPCRKRGSDENFKLWKKMIDKKGFNEGEAVLRFKSSMSYKNPAMRDFPFARINLTSHPRQKKKYRVWPLMNLAVTVDDIELNMTHIIRGKDHRDNAERQKMMYDSLGVKKFPWTAYLGRIHFKDLELSSSQFRKDIESGKYSGWDDPKLPTLASLKKRGYKPQAFWSLSERIGLSENDKVMDKNEFFTLLDSFNRE